ncbi:MAG: YggT family protein [Pseudomonadota bacterium]
MDFAEIGRTVLRFALDAMIYFILVKILMMWLTRFDVLNKRNYYVAWVSNAISAVMAPIYRPIRAIVPKIGGVDLSPIIVIVALISLRHFLLPLLA